MNDLTERERAPHPLSQKDEGGRRVSTERGRKQMTKGKRGSGRESINTRERERERELSSSGVQVASCSSAE